MLRRDVKLAVTGWIWLDDVKSYALSQFLALGVQYHENEGMVCGTGIFFVKFSIPVMCRINDNINKIPLYFRHDFRMRPQKLLTNQTPWASIIAGLNKNILAIVLG